MGLFLINKGKWNGKQLLDPSWIEASVTPHIYQHPELTPEENEKADDDGSQGYGYQIWMGRHHTYRAIGGQNQLIMVAPDYDFVLVCHSSIGDEAGFNQLIYDMLPAMSDKKLRPNNAFNLNTEISRYAIKIPFEGTSVSRVTTGTRRYRMDENASGILSTLFRFDSEGNCFLTFVTAGAIHNIPFGVDQW